MKTKQEQIDEMENELLAYTPMIYIPFERFNEIATAVYNIGYRKQSDTVGEFVEKVLKIGSKRPLCVFNEYGEGYIDCIENIKKIAKEYGVEVEE